MLLLIYAMHTYVCLLIRVLITSSEVFVPFVTTPKTDCVIFSITIMSYKQSAVQKTAQRDCPRWPLHLWTFIHF